MLIKRLILLLLFSSQAFASKCLLNDALKDPALSSNPQFWEEYSSLTQKGKSSDESLQLLIKKYSPSLQSTTTAATNSTSSFQKSLALNLDSKAEKEIKTLPKNLKGKVDEFLDAALKPGGIKEIRENPGRWHMEKLPQFGDNAYSIRLNDGYRVLFDVTDGSLQVRRVNKGQIHGN